VICADIPLPVGSRVILFGCAWPPDGYEGVVLTCAAERWEHYGHIVAVAVDDTRAPEWQRGREATPTGFHGEARAYPLWTRRLFNAIAAASERAQRAAVQRDALRSALPGERVAEELAALRALITKGGAL
jgi:hypothetical protein